MESDVIRLRRQFHEGRAELFPQSARLAPCRELMARYTR